MKKLLYIIALFLPISAYGESRIKDIVRFEGIRDNILMGSGIVVGLNGTGDNLNNSSFTKKSLEDFLGRVGINSKGDALKTKNVAMVTITATLPPFARQGTKIDVTVSTIGDAKSLQGGTLLATPLMAADGNVYAVAQGSVAIAGFQAAGQSTTINKGVATNGYIANGAIVEREIDFDLRSMDKMRLSLHNPDLTTSRNIATLINREMAFPYAQAVDPATVELTIPEQERPNIVSLLSEIEQLQLMTDNAAKIVIDEASGTIVIGDNVRIHPVAVAQGNLTVTIKEYPEVSQPNPFAPGGRGIVEKEKLKVTELELTELRLKELVRDYRGENDEVNKNGTIIAGNGGRTVVTNETEIEANEEGNQLSIVKGASLSELVNGLNSLGVSPRDLITILQNIKSLGALQAEIITK